MTENWLRWHVGTVTDPKWRVIARRSEQPIHIVLAVWAAMLETACNAMKRGKLEGWSSEDQGAALDLDPAQIDAVYTAMQGKVLDGDELIAWNKRQPKREDNSTGRVRAFRDRKSAEEALKRSETHGNAREEESRVDTSSLRSDAAVPAAPGKPIAEILFGECLLYLTANGLTEKQARPLIGKWRKAYGDGEVAAAIAEAQKDAASEPVAMVTAILQRRRGERPGGRVETRYSTASLAASILKDHQNDNHGLHESRNAPALQRSAFGGERSAGPLLLECDLQFTGPDEPEPG